MRETDLQRRHAWSEDQLPAAPWRRLDRRAAPALWSAGGFRSCGRWGRRHRAARTTAMPYGLLPVGMVAVTWRVAWLMTDSVFAPWSVT
jgi:hypothetical protein